MNSTCELGSDAARALKPYPAYKDSRIAWLGEVPEHWQVRRLKTLCSRSALYGANVAATSYTTAGVRFLRTTDITEDGQLNGRGVFLPQESVDNYLLADGDVLISRSGTIGRSFLYERRIHGPCAYAGYLVRFVPAPIALPKYILLFTKTHAFAGFLRVKAISSTIENVNGEKYANCPLPLPPHSEQAAIVRFLDHADRRIRRYIRAKQKLIALLEEQKQAVIHRAVTRGLDPNVRLKPSGVEWLGDVPEHWTLKRFKFLAQVTSGQVDPRRPEYRGKILVAPNHIRSSTGEIVHLETAEDQGADSGKYEVRRGQVIYSKIRPNLRKAAIAPLDCLCSADMYPITVREAELRPAYLLLLLLSPPFTKYAVDCSLRVAMPKVNRDALGGCWIWYPNLKEQDSVLEFIKNVGGLSGLAVAQAARKVSLLREYRTRLIADVVTGKLDVREAAAGLPDEVEELEPPDEADAFDGEEESPPTSSPPSPRRLRV